MIFHIADQNTWEMQQASGFYEPNEFAREGFIHCSNAHQVQKVAQKFFRGKSGLVLLEIDPGRFTPDQRIRLRYENLEGGSELFPHLYHPLPVQSVVSVKAFFIA